MATGGAEIPKLCTHRDAPGCTKRPANAWEPPVPREMPQSRKAGRHSISPPDLKRLIGQLQLCGNALDSGSNTITW